MRRSVLLVILFFLLTVAVRAAVIGGIGGLSDLTVSAACNQASVEFVFDNSVGFYDFITWEADVSGSKVGSGFLGGAGDLSNAPAVTTRTVTFSRGILTGETLNITLISDAGDKATVSVTVTTGCAAGTGEAPSTSSPASPPPCKLDDGRLDPSCGAPVVVYAEHAGDACWINIYSAYGMEGKGVRLVLAVPGASIAAVPENPAANTLIDSGFYAPLGTIAVYRLTTGEFQVNVGPYGDEPGSIYVLNFTGCGANQVYTSNSYRVQE